MALPQEKPSLTADDYWGLPKDVRAELIDGELWDLAAPSWTHQRIVGELFVRLKRYITEHDGSCETLVAPFAVDLSAEIDAPTIVEPDVLVVCDRSKLTERGCVGAPDFVAEVVSPSNPGMDYLSKLNLYETAGVREYWICDPGQGHTLVYDFEGESPLTVYPFARPVASSIFPGFEIDLAAVVTNM